MIQPVAGGKPGTHRYGFQGQEKDDEIKGTGNSINYKYRMRDPRIGRFFAVDPLASEFPWNSPYAFAENRVIDAIELEGAESLRVHSVIPLKNGKTLIRIIPDETVKNNASAPFSFRIPANVIPGIDQEQTFGRDDLGTPNFRLKGLQKQLGGFEKVQDRLFVDGKPFDNVTGSSFGVESTGTTTPGANLKDFIKGVVVDDFSLNELETINVPESQSFDLDLNGDFSGTGNTQVFNLTAPSSTTNAQFNLSFDDLGFPNTFSFTDGSGNSLGGGTVGPGSGNVSFNLPSGSSFNLSVTGSSSLGSGDAFSVTGTVTTTQEKTVIKK